jgi:hypothetical protein
MSYSNNLQIPFQSDRKGAIAPLSAFCMVIVMMMAAFAVDIGFIMVARSDLQRAADAAAQSAVLDYRNDGSLTSILTDVRKSAKTGVESNPILRDVATADLNLFNADPNGDIVLGRIDFEQPRNQMTFDSPDQYNGVRVTVRRSLDKNGAVPLFFGRMFGLQNMELEASATAALIKNVSGFKIPSSGENVPILPITVSVAYWDNLLDAGTFDDWSFDAENQIVIRGKDDNAEVVLFPNETGSAGNFGTVNIGTSSNSTSFLGNQIRNGVTQTDLDFHGGQLELNDSSQLTLSGSPGMSLGIEGALASLTGKVRVIPIYSSVSGDGNNAEFSIVRFEAVRIMAVQLVNGEKFVAVQPAKLSFKGVIQSPSSGTSRRVFSPPVIVQ